MSDSNAKQLTETSTQENEKRLKYLEFVQEAAICIIVCFSIIYEYAKEGSGPLKPGVQTVEATVKTVISPIYEKFHDVPFELLKFVDRKMEEYLMELDRNLPSLVKRGSRQARAVAVEAQRAGVVDAAKNITKNVYNKYEPAAKQLYHRYEPVAEQYVVFAWRSLNRLPLFPQVAQIALPTTAYWSAKYNQCVRYTEESGYAVATYLPLIPIDRIAKVFDEGSTVSTNGETAVAQ